MAISLGIYPIFRQTQVSLGLSQNECNEWAEKQHKVITSINGLHPKIGLKNPSIQAFKQQRIHFRKRHIHFAFSLFASQFARSFFRGPSAQRISSLGCPLLSDQPISHIIPYDPIKNMQTSNQHPSKSSQVMVIYHYIYPIIP